MSQKKNNPKKQPEEKKSYDDCPPIVMSVRNKTGVSFLQSQAAGKPFTGERVADQIISNTTSDIIFTSAGDKCAAATSEGIVICNLAREANKSFELIPALTIEYKTARWVSFSPQGKYLISFETYRSAVQENLVVWDTTTGEAIMKLSYPDEISSALHLPVQWTADESYLFVLKLGSLSIYATTDHSKPVHTLQHKKMSQFQVSPSGSRPINEELKLNYHEYVAVFSPSYGETPSKLYVYRIADLVTGKSIQSIHTPTPAEIACGQYKPNSGPVVKTCPLKHVSMLTTFRATEASMSWHGNSQALLAQTFYEDDETASSSYYGENRLYVVYVDREPLAVTFSAQGAIQDAQWCPTGFEFATLHGESRSAQATTWFARDCTPVKELGAGAWNTIRYSPNGKYILLAGFGSLAGRMEVWDKTKLVRIHRGQDHDSPRFVQWTPCGRFFYTATVYPWLRVGNQFKIYSIDGTVIYKETPPPELVVIENKAEVGEDAAQPLPPPTQTTEGHFCQISVLPYDYKLYPDYSVPQQVLERAKKEMAADASGASSQSSSSKASSGKYIPPHLRNKDPSAAAPAPSSLGKSNTSHPRDLAKERKMGNVVDTSIGAAQVRAERPPPKQSVKKGPQASWRRSD